MSVRIGVGICALMLFAFEAGAQIKPLTRDMVAVEIQKGQSAKRVESLCRSYNWLWTPLSKAKSRRFLLVVRTPKCDVAYRAFEAKRVYKSLDASEVVVAPPEDQVVIVTVQDSMKDRRGLFRGPTRAGSVQTVILRRGATVIEPLTSQVEGLRGDFSFPVSAFAPGDVPLDIIIVPVSTKRDDRVMKRLERFDLLALE